MEKFNINTKRRITFIGSLLAVCFMTVCMFGQYILYKNNYYSLSKEELLYERIQEQIMTDARDIANYYLYDVKTLDIENRFDEDVTNIRYRLIDENKHIIGRNTYSWAYTSTSTKYCYEIAITSNTAGKLELTLDCSAINYALNQYTFYVYIDSSLPADDNYQDIFKRVETGYQLLNIIYPLSFLASISTILFMFLFVKYHKRVEESEEGITPINYEWIRKTVKFIMKWLKIVWNSLSQYLQRLSIIKRSVLIISGFCIMELIVIYCSHGNTDLQTLLWLLTRVIIIVFIFNILLDLSKIKTATTEIAEGHLDYKIQTYGMHYELKKYADFLNQIGDVLNVAIEKKLQSERMKTELITNVSHDIKTPITSIINYAYLIEKEPCDSPKHKEYAEVLVRKATHLKRLLDDLVEASKASTGNIEMKMEDCEANVLLTQVVGEYEQRLEAAKLTLITKAPEAAVMIHVDSKRIWRVFENLMMNACKYSLEGSRVYLNLDIVGNEAIFSFRNTSKCMLNISSEELMERFVRGDSSRSTEGNGLGLSIAKSLTELQNGKMDIIIDGDLFKVILKFPVVS